MTSSAELKEMGVEWVSGSKNGKRQGYFRHVPKTRAQPTLRQAAHRLRFSQVSYNTFGVKGTDETADRREISRNAKVIGDKLRGTGQPIRELTLQQKLLQLILRG